MQHPEPFDRSLEAFLTDGEDEDVELDVDGIFAKDFQRMWAEARRYEPDQLAPEGPRRPSLVDPSLHYQNIGAGILLYDGDEPVGGYIGCDVSIDGAYQGRGLGTEIIIERCLKDGCSPVWALDAPAYTPAGVAAHESAWWRVRNNPEETRARAARIAEPA